MSEDHPRRDRDQSDFVVPDDHGPTDRTRGTRRTITSAVWGGTAAAVTSEHGQDVRPWNPDCSWYKYGLDLCLNGCQHPGMDIGIARGTPLRAAEGGTVEFAGAAEFYRPRHVRIRTASGALHIYAHMWTIDPAVVTNGQVQAGQPLGTSGEQTLRGTLDQPDGTGAHLHFEVRSGGCAVDPEPALLGASTGNGAVVTAFAPGDRIGVVDPPLRLRSGPGLNAEILEELAAGVELCVTGGPQDADGFTWYAVNKADGGGSGWVAGSFCALVAAQGCA